MIRGTLRDTLQRSYTAGGARCLIDTIDDGKHWQETSCGIMKGESRSRVECPQNFGFTSVVMPATKGKDGQIQQCAEGIMSFLGGNRALPICGVMDDRRHRLKGCEPGDVAMYGIVKYFMQLHFNKDGGFWTGPDSGDNAKLRMQLAPNQQQQDQRPTNVSSAAADGKPRDWIGVGTRSTGDGTGSSGQGGQGGQGGQQMGQQPNYKAGENSKKFSEINPQYTQHTNSDVRLLADDMDTAVRVIPGKVNLGGLEAPCQVVTICGPSKKVYAKLD